MKKATVIKENTRDVNSDYWEVEGAFMGLTLRATVKKIRNAEDSVFGYFQDLKLKFSDGTRIEVGNDIRRYNGGILIKNYGKFRENG